MDVSISSLLNTYINTIEEDREEKMRKQTERANRKNKTKKELERERKRKEKLERLMKKESAGEILSSSTESAEDVQEQNELLEQQKDIQLYRFIGNDEKVQQLNQFEFSSSLESEEYNTVSSSISLLNCNKIQALNTKLTHYLSDSELCYWLGSITVQKEVEELSAQIIDEMTMLRKEDAYTQRKHNAYSGLLKYLHSQVYSFFVNRILSRSCLTSIIPTTPINQTMPICSCCPLLQ